MLYKVVSAFWDEKLKDYVYPGQDYELDEVRGTRLVAAGCVLEIELKPEPPKNKKPK